jgi:hypothetical protein
VLDGRAVSRGPYFPHGNPALQPSYFAMDNTVSPTHTSLRSEHALSHHPLLSITRRSFHPFHAVAAYLGMIMPFLVYVQSRLAIIFCCANASFLCELKPSKCLISSSPLSACELDSLRY